MEWVLLFVAIFLLSSSSLPLFCASDDRLSPGESISLNKTLVSDGGAFALGFFFPDDSSSNFYLGIWYNNIAQRTIVWVANREEPINDSSATLTISNDSNLLIMGSNGNVFWSSNVRSPGSSPNNTLVAVLLNNGNLVLREGNNTILWQCFDHPADTLIPGMKLEFRYKTHKANRITSWKDPQDPSRGNFSFGADPNTSLQLFTWQGSKLYWRSSVWNGRLFSGAQVTNSSYITYVAIIDTEDEIYMTFSLSDGSSNARYKLDHLGQLQLLGWDYSLNNWSIAASWPSSVCDRYGYCGPFGYCDSTESVPTCKCLEGFEPNFPHEWNGGNFSGGCVRKTALDCGYGDGFLILRGMKLPDRFLFLKNKTVGECAAKCIANCSCNAYAYANLSMGTGNVSRCLVWMEELLDAGMVSSGGEDLYLRLLGSQLGSKRNKRIIIILAPVSGAILLITLTYLAWKFRDKIKGIWKDGKNKGRLLGDLSLSTEFPMDFSGSSGFGEGKTGHGLQPPLINFESIVAATNNFSDSHKLGQGGFGKVYKGKLPRGQEIAVKRLSRNSGQGLVEFKNEVLLIAKLQHRNLVRLLGCCIQGDEKLLIYEYMSNKSLDAFLFDPAKKQLLDWEKRFNIIKGIARGLLYLHQDSRLRIIHRDLKASNILLDQDMNPKISDFGMARIFGGDQNEVNTNRVVGTYGYMSPEYAMGGLFSVKSDVYSFGVLILEIVSGSRNSSFHLTMDSPSLLAYAWELWKEGKAKDLVDTSLLESCSPDEVFRCILVGLLCVQDHSNDRPTMLSIVSMLENETTINLTPGQPTFTVGKKLDECDAQMQNLEIFSANNLTITMAEGR
ncbi:G-type lectin S-receptor-like serine/threonine-protein kinase B120 isoform X2 [Elaeis guineensis]|uniref:G-type lectin S-receptor-like serine/threonine-protein kinase B120 isoform X2 n=1 Tax=Elaeis guineensis var. tenera TaxID=51953 RepID=UPI00094FA88D